VGESAEERRRWNACRGYRGRDEERHYLLRLKKGEEGEEERRKVTGTISDPAGQGSCSSLCLMGWKFIQRGGVLG